MISLPGGYVPEDGKAEGDDVQVLITGKLLPGGQLQIISVDGAAYSKEKKPEPDQETKVLPVDMAQGPDNSSLQDRIQAAVARNKGAQ
jgi:hypothetical protein